MRRPRKPRPPLRLPGHLTTPQRALAAHSYEWHPASGADPERCQDCRALILAVAREQARKEDPCPRTA